MGSRNDEGEGGSMNQNDIVSMARAAGFAYSWSEAAGEALERFAALVAAAERKKCAELCDNAVRISPTEHAKLFTEICADAIRARGK